MSVQFLWLSSVEWIKILEYWSYFALLFCLHSLMTCCQEQILSCSFRHYNCINLRADEKQVHPGPLCGHWLLFVFPENSYSSRGAYILILPVLLISSPLPKHSEVWFLDVNILRPLCFAEHQCLIKDWIQTEIQKTRCNKDSTSQ